MFAHAVHRGLLGTYETVQKATTVRIDTDGRYGFYYFSQVAASHRRYLVYLDATRLGLYSWVYVSNSGNSSTV